MRKEVWRDIPNYRGVYQVSNLGNVRSCFRNRKLLKQDICGNVYFRVTLFRNGNRKKIYVHQLVAMAFLNHSNKDRSVVIDHINNIKTDNRVENLQVVTNRFNVSKNLKKGTSKYVGVSKHSQSNKWVSSIWIDGLKEYLGVYNTELEAKTAYELRLNNGRI